jgi:hypothetical protein
MSRALSPIPPTPLAPDLFAYKKTPALNAGVFFMRLQFDKAGRLVPRLTTAAGSGGRASFSGCLNATAGLRARRFASDFLQIPVVQIPVVAVASKNCGDREEAKSHSSQSERIRFVPTLPPPILLGLALHGRRIRIFDFQPKRRATRAIDRAKPLRHDPLAAKPASLAKYDRAVLHEMLVEYDA